MVQDLGTTRSRAMRGLLREALGMGPDLIRQDMEILKQGVYQLGAIGRNLNQQMRALNTGKLLGRPADISITEQVKEQVEALEEQWLLAAKQSKNRWVGKL